MTALYGVALYVAGGDRGDLAAALALVTPSVPHLFFENEQFDRYLELLAVENLAVARAVNPKGGLSWILDVELTTPIPTEAVARTLSKPKLLVARPRDEVARCSSYLVYQDGEFQYEAELEDEGVCPRLRPLG